MKFQRSQPSQMVGQGFALITSLILLASCTILVIAYLSIAKNEILSARRYGDQLKAEMAVQAGFEEAKILLQDLTKNDDYLVTMVPNKSTWGTTTNDGDTDNDHANEYYFISQTQDDGTVTHIPLFSGGLAHSSSIFEGPTWQRDTALDPADGVLGTSSEYLLAGTSEAPVRVDQAPLTSWLRPENQVASSKGKEGIRYTYWIQDLQGSIQYDKAGYERIELSDAAAVTPTFSQGETGVTVSGTNASGLGDSLVMGFQAGDPRHGGRVLGRLSSSLNYRNFWFPDELKNPYLGAAGAKQSNLAGQLAPGLSVKELICGFQYHHWSENQGIQAMRLSRSGGLLSNSSLASGWGTNYYVFGLRPYLERQRIPKGFGYNTTITQPGFQPGDRGNLNAWVAQGGNTGANALATFLDDTLPNDWAQRGGGIATSLGSNDYSQTYLKALAANIIDYADSDSIPTRDATGLNRGFMRGIEAMPMVNEVAFQFRWKSKSLLPDAVTPTKWKIEFEVIPIIEFWNPTNKAISNQSVGLVFWDSPNGAAPDLGSRIATHYRLSGAGAYPDAYMSPGDTSGYLTDIINKGASVIAQSDLILWEDISLPANGFAAHLLAPVTFVYEYPTIADTSQTPPVVDIDEILLRGEKKDGSLVGNDRASRYAMVMAGSSGVTQTAEDQILYDEAHGRTERHGGANAEFRWAGITPLGTNMNVYASNHAAHDGYDHTTNLSGRIINVGDPFSSFYLANIQKLIGFADSSSLGGRNYRKSTSIGGNNEKTELKDTWERYLMTGGDVRTQKEVRVPFWPDGGYLTKRGTSFSGDEESAIPDSFGGDLTDGYHVPELDYDGDGSPDESAAMMAPFRLNNSGRYWSVTELSHVWDPIFWWEERPTDDWNKGSEFDDNGNGSLAPTHAMNAHVGGGSTLRIGRPEHSRLRHDVAANGVSPTDDNWHAMALLDVLAAGTNGSNVGELDRPDEYDPQWHIEPPTARNAAAATNSSYDYYHVWGPELHAESPYRYINGQVNLNTTVFSWSTFALGLTPLSSDPGYGVNHQDPYAPGNPSEGIDWENWGLNRWGPDLRSLLQRHRPFYAPSQLSAIFDSRFGPNSIPSDKWRTESNSSGDEPVATQVASGKITRQKRGSVDMSDAVREEQFARMFNLSTLSSRNFRIFVMGEQISPNGTTIASSRKVYEVFAKPIRDSNGLVTQVKLEVISEKDQ